MPTKGSQMLPTSTSLHLPIVPVARTFFHASHCSFPLSVGLNHHFSAYLSSEWWILHLGQWVFVGGEGGNGRGRMKKKFVYNPKDLHKVNTFWKNRWMCFWRDSESLCMEVRGCWSMVFCQVETQVRPLPSLVGWLVATLEGNQLPQLLALLPCLFLPPSIWVEKWRPRRVTYRKAKERLISLRRMNGNGKFPSNHIIRPVYPWTKKPVWWKLYILVYTVLWLSPVEFLWR